MANASKGNKFKTIKDDSQEKENDRNIKTDILTLLDGPMIRSRLKNFYQNVNEFLMKYGNNLDVHMNLQNKK